MTTVYLIRHAEAEGNLYRIAQGQHNSNLTDRGWRQVQALQRRFQDIHVDAVYSSDLFRTRATASAIYLPKNLPLHCREDLREIYVGDWEGRTWGDIARTTPQEMEDFGSRMDRWRIPNAETPAQVLQRVKAAVQSIVRQNPDRAVAVFSHGYAIRLLLADLQGFSLRDTGTKTPTGDNTAVSLLEGTAEDLRVVYQYDNSHLKTPEYMAGDKLIRRNVGLEPGLWFRPLECAGERLAQAWRETGESGPVPEAPVALEGLRAEEPVGMLLMAPETGRILLTYIRPDCRKHGFGVQLIGQAVQHTRALGGDAVSAFLSENSPALSFFRDCGFQQEGPVSGERVLLQKNIGFDPRI